MAIMDHPVEVQNDFTNAESVALEEGQDPEKESAELNGVVAWVKGRFERSKTRRMQDEKRWIRAFRNHRGVYEATTSTEKSQAFIKVTKTKVNAAYDQTTEVLFAGGVFPIGIEASKVPTGVAESVYFDPKEVKPEGAPASKPSSTVARKEISESLGALKASLDRVKEDLKEGQGLTPTALTWYPAQEQAKKMQKQIHDQLGESDANKHLRSTVFEMALFGTGIMKGPFAVDKEYPKWDEKGIYKPVFESIPMISHTSIWASYPDPDARNMEEAEYFIERHRLSKTQLRQLKKRPHFREDSIEIAIENGANYVREYWETDIEDSEDGGQTGGGDIARYEVLEFWGTIDAETAEMADFKIPKEFKDRDELQMNIWICNDTIIRLVLNPFTPSRIPYYAVPYEHNPYSFFGIGVAENMEDTQLVMNGSVRMAIDNAALSSNLIFEVDETNLVPGQDLTMHPGKIIRRQAGAPGQALFATKYQNVTNECFMMFDKMRQLADESTGIQSYSHGGVGVSGVGRTASGMSMLMGASAQSIKSVVRNIDDYLLAPLGKALFAFNMQFKFDEDFTKGDLSVVAKGTESLMRNEVRSQKLLQLLQVAGGNPMLAPYLKADYIMRELAASLDLDEEKVVNDPREAAIQAKLMAENMKAMGAIAPPAGGAPGGPPGVSDPTGNGGGNIAPGAAPEPGAAGFTGAGGGANGGQAPAPAAAPAGGMQ